MSLSILVLSLTSLALSACSCEGEEELSSDGGGGALADGGVVGGDGSTPGGDAAVSTHRSLRLDPPRARLVMDGTAPARQDFRALAVRADGTEEEVTARATFRVLDATIGTLASSTFTAVRAGTTTVEVTFASLTASAVVEVVAERVTIDPALPSNAPMVFETAPADPRRAPTLVYPNDGVLLPPNLGGVEVHWRRAQRDDDLFEVRFESALGRVVAYVPCQRLGDGCVYTPDAAAWRLLAESNKGGAAVQLSVRETDDRGTGVGQSAVIQVSFAAQAVQGGLYYWTTSNGSAIMRVDFGAQTPPEKFFPFEGGGCYGCHALSRNGRKMTLSRDGQNQGQIRGIDVAARRIVFGADDQEREQFQSWNPSSDRFAGIYGDRAEGRNDIRIRDGDDGHVIETITLGVEPTHPDWSPGGDRIAFTHVTEHGTSQRPGRGAIAFTRLTNGTWSAPQTLVPAEDTYNRYYPSYAPDGAFLVFNESRCNGSSTYGGECDGDADDSARLWAIGSDGGNRIELVRANAPGVGDEGRTTLANTFPKWAPFVDARRADGSGRVMWMTFSSRRHYGLRSPNGSDQQLWMVAVDPDAIGRGEDGSFAAFALPFQDLGTSNHVAQWASQIVPPTDTDGGVPADDAGVCGGLGDPCDPANSSCCAGTQCEAQGPGVFVCRFSF